MPTKTINDLVNTANILDGDELAFWNLANSRTDKITYAQFKTDLLGLAANTEILFINGTAIDGDSRLTYNPTTNVFSLGGNFNINGNNIINTGTLTLPTSTDTLVGRATTDTLTNKGIDADGTGNVITNIGDAEIQSHTSTKITITAKPQLNSAIVYTDQTNTFGAFAQIFPSTQLQLNNLANTFQYIFTGSAILANRAVTIPLLAAPDIFVMEGFGQTLTNKTLTSPVINTQISGGITNGGNITASNFLVGGTAAQTLTNKTFGSTVQLKSTTAPAPAAPVNSPDFILTSQYDDAVSDKDSDWKMFVSATDDAGNTIFSLQNQINGAGYQNYITGDSSDGTTNLYGAGNLGLRMLTGGPQLILNLAGNGKNITSLGSITSITAGGYRVLAGASSATQPMFVPERGDQLAGLGGVAGAPAMITNSISRMTWTDTAVTTGVGVDINIEAAINRGIYWGDEAIFFDADRLVVKTSNIPRVRFDVNGMVAMVAGTGITDLGTAKFVKLNITAGGIGNSVEYAADTGSHVFDQYLTLTGITAPVTDTVGFGRLYINTTGSQLEFRDDGGNVTLLSIAAGGGYLPLAGGTLSGALDITPDGTAALPALRIGTEDDGYYRSAANIISLSLNNVERHSWSGDSFSMFTTANVAVLVGTTFSSIDWYVDDDSAGEGMELAAQARFRSSGTWDATNAPSRWEILIKNSADVAPTPKFWVQHDNRVAIGTLVSPLSGATYLHYQFSDSQTPSSDILFENSNVSGHIQMELNAGANTTGDVSLHFRNSGDSYTFGIDGSADQFNITSAGTPDANIIMSFSASSIGFFGAAPVLQPSHIIDADGSLADITTKFNTLLAQMATTGLQAAT